MLWWTTTFTNRSIWWIPVKSVIVVASPLGRVGGPSKAIAFDVFRTLTPIILVSVPPLLSRRARSFLLYDSPLRHTFASSLIENNVGGDCRGSMAILEYWNWKILLLHRIGKIRMVNDGMLWCQSGLLLCRSIFIIIFTCYEGRVWCFTIVNHFLNFASNFVHYLSEDPALLLNHECFKFLEQFLIRAIGFHTSDINPGITFLTPPINDAVQTFVTFSATEAGASCLFLIDAAPTLFLLIVLRLVCYLWLH